MTSLIGNLKYSVRQLRNSPGFTAIVLIILAIGIGANTAIFSVVNAVLLRPLPYSQPDRIVRIQESQKSSGMDGVGSSHRNITYWRQHNQVFESITGRENFRVLVTGVDKPFYVKAAAVSSCFFSVMGARPVLGQTFSPDEEQPGKEQVMVLSHALWRDRFARDPQTVGRMVLLDNKEYTIIGVMAPDFRESLNRDAPFWVPLVLRPEDIGGGTGVWARLKRGVTVDQAQADINRLEADLIRMDPHLQGYTVEVIPFLAYELGSNARLVKMLWGAVGLVLLVACANIAGLFLLRNHKRRPELAIRVALGASRGAVMRQLLTESLIVSLAAGVLAVFVAFAGVRLLLWACPSDIPRIDQTRIDTSALLVSLGLAAVTGLLSGLVPAWNATGMQTSQALKAVALGMAFGRNRQYLRGGLIVSQVAVALTLLMAVGMLTQSLIRMQKEELGFRPENVLVATIELPEVKYPEHKQWGDFYRQLTARVQSLPEVEAAAVASGGIDLATGGGFSRFQIEGREPATPTEVLQARQCDVSPDFFATMGMSILKGRGFTEQDTLGQGAAVVVIDENMVRKYFADKDPMSQHINGRPVVGVVSTIRDFEELSPTATTLYEPITDFCYKISDLVVRTKGDPLRVADALRAQVSALDKDLEIQRVTTLEAKLSEMLAGHRFITSLLGFFAQISVILAAVGLFGLLQYTVTHCTRDIGIRMAIGATQSNILYTILKQGILLALIGIGLGLAGGYVAGRILKTTLYESKPTDPLVLGGTILAILAMALLACYLPARRAAKIQPMQALRYE